MANVCVVEDKELMRESVCAILERGEHRAQGFQDGEAALRAVRGGAFDLVVSDLKMPQLDGIGLLERMRGMGLDTPVILMTAFGTVKTAVEAMKLGAYDYIQKPFEADALLLQVERATEHYRLRKENEALRMSVRDQMQGRVLVGASSKMAAIRETCKRVAGSAATVLIQGESGTGKEMVAREIHALSPRADRPMLCLNCAALSTHLLESELFGHERGAFTGADRVRKGRFELAHGGTLLLDEISEMALPLQAKLLRVLQEHQFERVGSSETRTVDVRVMATTNRVLRQWVARGRFREDLFFRLNVLPIELPPLREHREDIPQLVEYFLSRVAAREGRTAPKVADEAMRLLTGYSWPGNVRELENLCERAAVLQETGDITAGALSGWLVEPDQRTSGAGVVRPGFILEDMERHLIERTLKQYNGHRVRTAKALGIGVRTLGLKLKKWRDERMVGSEAQN